MRPSLSIEPGPPDLAGGRHWWTGSAPWSRIKASASACASRRASWRRRSHRSTSSLPHLQQLGSAVALPRTRPLANNAPRRRESAMADELIKPIDENTANAIEESAKALGKGFDLVGGLGAYLARALGGAPENLIGLLVGDWLIHKRVRRWSELQAETKRISMSAKLQSLTRTSARRSRFLLSRRRWTKIARDLRSFGRNCLPRQ